MVKCTCTVIKISICETVLVAKWWAQSYDDGFCIHVLRFQSISFFFVSNSGWNWKYSCISSRCNPFLNLSSISGTVLKQLLTAWPSHTTPHPFHWSWEEIKIFLGPLIAQWVFYGHVICYCILSCGSLEFHHCTESSLHVAIIKESTITGCWDLTLYADIRGEYTGHWWGRRQTPTEVWSGFHQAEPNTAMPECNWRLVRWALFRIIGHSSRWFS